MSTVKEYKQYFTPIELAEFMVNLVPDTEIKTIIDLSMGECGLLEAAKKRWHNAQFLGADIDHTLLDEINMRSPYIHTFAGDSLSSELFKWNIYNDMLNNQKFDLAIANPPFNYFDQKLVSYSDARSKAMPIELRFLLKYIDIVRNDGYICIIMPYGFLSLDQYAELRREILRKVILRKVIKIFDGCFERIDAETCLILMQKKNENDRYIQSEISLEYLDNQYLLWQDIKIQVDSTTSRFDLEYNRLIQDIYRLTDKCKYPTYKLIEFVGNIKRGKTLAKRSELIADRGLRYLHTTDVKNCMISKKTQRYVKRGTEYFRDAIVCSETLLIGRVGKACIGKVALIPAGSGKAAISDCLFGIEIKNIDPYYLALYLSSQIGQLQLKGLARGSCSKYIIKEDLLNIIVIVPDIEYQLLIREKFLEILSKPGRTKKEQYIKELVEEIDKYLGRE